MAKAMALEKMLGALILLTLIAIVAERQILETNLVLGTNPGGVFVYDDRSENGNSQAYLADYTRMEWSCNIQPGHEYPYCGSAHRRTEPPGAGRFYGSRFGRAALVQAHIRTTDFFARWGGEEFVLVCRNTHLQDASQIAEKLRSLISQEAFDFPGVVRAGFGVATLRSDENLEPFFARADRALYDAKHTGRNRVEISPAVA